MTAIRLGAYGNALARLQAANVVAALRAIDPRFEVETLEIPGTADEFGEAMLESTASTPSPSALERALLAGEIDVAVQELTDLPAGGSPDLAIAAVPPRGPAEDVLCARDGRMLDALPRGARVGTSSARRAAQVRAQRRDIECVPLRGDLAARLARVDTGDLDAVVLARAALVQLGLEAHVTEVFRLSAVLPAPAQGAIAVQARVTDEVLLERLAALDDTPTRRAVTAERTLLRLLGGGRSAPVGAYATAAADGAVILDAAVFRADGSAIRAVAAQPDARSAGEDVVRRLLACGAGPVLAEFVRASRAGIS